MKNILFVCTGNTCRSTMAEGIMNDMIKKRGLTDISVGSAGISAFVGDEVSINAVEVLKNMGIDISNHRANKISHYNISDVDTFVCMSENHRIFLNFLGVDNTKIFCLNILDPYMLGIDAYKKCAVELRQKLEQIFEELIKC